MTERDDARTDTSCRKIVELVTDYLEGDLSARDSAAIDEHLSGCAGCRAYLDQLRLVLRLASRSRT